MSTNKSSIEKITLGSFLIALGVVYGDIGTSPLYVMKSIINDNGGLESITPDFILGVLSLIFWTMTLLTTIKYVLITLKADNKGEGGIFSLY
ncbi:MAG: KUP/HAK/KT family potassium transporter, partial [Clostridium perfringens]|nr:KUP/HAK/KT family potassium transporter [Clostridium perfringens]